MAELDSKDKKVPESISAIRAAKHLSKLKARLERIAFCVKRGGGDQKALAKEQEWRESELKYLALHAEL